MVSFLQFVFCLIGWRHRFFELLSVTRERERESALPPSPDSRETPSTAPRQRASCYSKGAFKRGRHGLPEKVFRPWKSLTFPEWQVLQTPGSRFTGHLTGCLTGSLCTMLYGVPSRDPVVQPLFLGCHVEMWEPGTRGDLFDVVGLSCSCSSLLRCLCRGRGTQHEQTFQKLATSLRDRRCAGPMFLNDK